MKKIILALTALAVISSCSKEMLEEHNETVDGTRINMQVLSPETRTAFGENQKSVLWEAQDQLSVFLKKADQSFGTNTLFSKGAEANSFSGTFSKAEAPSETEENTYFAIYPYNAQFASPEGAKLQIPSQLTQIGCNNMDHLHVPLVGSGSATGLANPTIQMKHQAVVLKILVKNTGKDALTVNSVKVTADAKLTGEYKVNASTLSISPEESASNTALLNVENGMIEAEKSSTFYLMTSAFSLKEAGKKLQIEVATDKGNMIWEKFGKGMDFVAGHIYQIGFDFHATTENDLIHLAGWKNVTTELQTKNTLTLSPELQIYKCDKINGVQGNIGYAITIPAGKIDMKVIEKNMRKDDPTRRLSSVLREEANRSYSIFIPVQGPGVWQPADYSYYSSLAYGVDNNGKTCVLRADGWGGKIKSHAPALAVSNGVASMENASAVKGANELKKYTNVKGEGGVLWEGVDAAFGGYFQIVKNGEILINGEGNDAYKAFTAANRPTNLLCNLTPSWKKTDPIELHDALRTGRLGIGCTAKGDLVIYMHDKYVNTHNQGQGKDNGRNGNSKDTIGVTLYELATVMHDLGCTDVMTMEDYNWSYVVLQDGQQRGYDLVKTNSRWNFGKNDWKGETSEIPNLFVVCIK